MLLVLEDVEDGGAMGWVSVYPGGRGGYPAGGVLVW